MYKNFVKRGIDIILGLIGLIVLIIPMLIIGMMIKHEDKGPALFWQKRVGRNKNGQISYFLLPKFRSMLMSTPHDVPTHMLKNPDQYITGIGSWLRKYSLDELPQIWSIFKGDMSIIGPRPALWNQYDLIREREKCCANDVRPGLSGWAQVNGRDEIEINEKAVLDGYYVMKMSFAFDIKCFVKTISTVISRKGVVEGGTGELFNKEEEV